MMKAGDKVTMNDNYSIAKRNKGKVFTVLSGPYEVCGTKVVTLKDYGGCYPVNGLTVVEEGEKA